MMLGVENNMYRFEETEMLANKICNIFDKKVWDNSLLIQEISERHNPEGNALQIIKVYNKIILD